MYCTFKKREMDTDSTYSKHYLIFGHKLSFFLFSCIENIFVVISAESITNQIHNSILIDIKFCVSSLFKF